MSPQDPIAALKALVEKLDAVHADPQYKGVWTLAHIHGYHYTGLDYGDELTAAKDALEVAAETRRSSWQPLLEELEAAAWTRRWGRLKAARQAIRDAMGINIQQKFARDIGLPPAPASPVSSENM